jgi:4'-phosphopantetheinyl transferase
MALLHLTFAPCPLDRLPKPGADEAHVWQVDLETACDNLLSPLEQERACAMRHAEKRRHFIAARSALRLILSKYVDSAPEKLPLATATQGKPFLDLPDAPQFNVTHARGKALIGVAQVAVGVDLEFARSVRNLDRLVENYFAPEEEKILTALPDDQRAQAFLAAWTRKEACLKATGEGIAGGLHRYRVTLRAQEEAKLVSIDGNETAARDWSLHAFAAFGDGQAAICAASPRLTVQGFAL